MGTELAITAALGFLRMAGGGDAAVSGRVLAPDGTPAAASVHFVWNENGWLRWASAGEPDERSPGTFRVELDGDDLEGGLFAQAGGRSAWVAPVRAGDREVVVRLREPLIYCIDVRDDDGREPERWHAAWHTRILGVWLERSFGWEECASCWRLPELDHRVVLSAGEDYRPFEQVVERPADGWGENLLLILTRYPRLEGVVLGVDGEPTPYASVSLWPASRSAREPLAELEGKPGPARWPPGMDSTDERGRFSLPVESGGRYVVRASRAFQGQCELGPLVLDDGEGRSDLLLQLEPLLGSLEGRLLGSAEAATVGASLFGPHGFDLTVEPDGTFRAGALLAGDYELHLWREGRPVEPRLDPTGVDGGLVFPLRVETGRTTEVELDLSGPAPCRLVASLAADGRPLFPGWSCVGEGRVRKAGATLKPWRSGSGGALSKASIDTDGRLRLVAMEPEEVLLSLDLESEDGIRWQAFDRLTLAPGEQSWDLDVPTGALRVQFADAAACERAGELCYRWRGPGEVRVIAREPLWQEDESRFFPGVPVGAGELIGGPEATVLASVTIAAGETASVELR